MARQRDIPAAVAEAAIVLIVLFLAFVAAFAGWAVGHATPYTDGHRCRPSVLVSVCAD